MGLLDLGNPGYGIGFSAEPKPLDFENIILKRQQLQEQQRAQQMKLAGDQQEQFNKDADSFRQEKVHPIYTAQVQKAYSDFADAALELRRQNPYNYTATPQYSQLRNKLFGDLNNYVGASKTAYELQTLDPNKYDLIPQYSGVQDALKNNDYDALTKAVPGGLLTGQYYYNRINPASDLLNSVDKLEYNMQPGQKINISSQGPAYIISKDETRNPDTVKKLAGDYYDRNLESIKYQYPQYIGNRQQFIDDMLSQMPVSRQTSYAQMKPKATNVKVDIGGEGDQADAEDILHKMGSIINGVQDVYEPNSFFSPDIDHPNSFFGPDGQLQSNKKRVSMALADLPIGKTIDENNKVIPLTIQYIENKSDGSFVAHLSNGTEKNFTSKNAYQVIIRPYLQYSGRGEKYKSFVNKTADNFSILKKDGTEDWSGVNGEDNSSSNQADPPKKIAIPGFGSHK